DAIGILDLNMTRVLEHDVEESRWLRLGDLALDRFQHHVFVQGRRMTLTANEFKLLEHFMLNPEKVVGAKEILVDVWRNDPEVVSNVVPVYMSYLRNKVGSKYFKTIRNVGWKLVPSSSASAQES